METVLDSPDSGCSQLRTTLSSIEAKARYTRHLHPDRNTMWGSSGPDVQNIKIHHDIYSLLTVADINVAEMDAVDDDLDEVGGSRTELDSHLI